MILQQTTQSANFAQVVDWGPGQWLQNHVQLYDVFFRNGCYWKQCVILEIKQYVITEFSSNECINTLKIMK